MSPIDRRTFLKGTTWTVAAAGLAACGSGTPSREISPSAIEDLRRKMSGTVLTPDDPAFAASGLPANTRYAGIRPAAIAQCRTTGDVSLAVRWAVDNGIAPVARGGGHNYAGLSTTEGLLLDLSALNTVGLTGDGHAVVGGAAHNKDVFSKLNNGPLQLPGGTCLGVGVGGLVLGGGIGYNTHWAGLTADRLRSTRMVTASGDVVNADATTNPDLFWACRGATGNQFGIHTEFTFELVEVPRKVAYYRYEWRGATDAVAVLAAFDRLMKGVPAALNAVAMAQATPVGPGGAEEAIDVMSRGQYMGPVSELVDLVKPLLDAAPKTTKVTVEEHPYWEAAQIFLTDEGKPHAWGDISRYSRDVLPTELWQRQVDLLTQCPSRDDTANGSLWALGWIGGPVVDSFARTDTAYVHRGMNLLIRPTPVWPRDAAPSIGDDLVAWTDDMIAVIAASTPNESYQNFPNRRIKDWKQQYFAENLDRLRSVKATYDPGNVFTSEQGIPLP